MIETRGHPQHRRRAHHRAHARHQRQLHRRQAGRPPASTSSRCWSSATTRSASPGPGARRCAWPTSSSPPAASGRRRTISPPRPSRSSPAARCVMDQAVAERIRQMFAAMGRVMPENNLKQAQFPEGAVIIPNALGTAPGFRLDLQTEHGARHLHRPARRAARDEADDRGAGAARGCAAARAAATRSTCSHTFQTFGISESALDELVAGAVDPSRGPHRLPRRVPADLRAPHRARRRRRGRAAAPGAAGGARCASASATYAYGEGDTTMEAVVGELLARARHEARASPSRAPAG